MESKVAFFDISNTHKICVYLFDAFFPTLPDLIIVPEPKSFDRDKEQNMLRECHAICGYFAEVDWLCLAN